MVEIVNKKEENTSHSSFLCNSPTRRKTALKIVQFAHGRQATVFQITVSWPWKAAGTCVKKVKIKVINCKHSKTKLERTVNKRKSLPQFLLFVQIASSLKRSSDCVARLATVEKACMNKLWMGVLADFWFPYICMKPIRPLTFWPFCGIITGSN